MASTLWLSSAGEQTSRLAWTTGSYRTHGARALAIKAIGRSGVVCICVHLGYMYRNFEPGCWKYQYLFVGYDFVGVLCMDVWGSSSEDMDICLILCVFFP